MECYENKKGLHVYRALSMLLSIPSCWNVLCFLLLHVKDACITRGMLKIVVVQMLPQAPPPLGLFI